MTREEAIKHLEEWKECISSAYRRQVIDMAIEALSADVLQGEWLQREIIDDDMECGVNDDATECSVCGYVFDSHYWAKTYFNYCPNCGAKMKGGDSE